MRGENGVRIDTGGRRVKGVRLLPAGTGVEFEVRDGYAVAKDGLLGELFNPFGERIFEFRAPFSGVVNYVVGTPPVSEGEPIGMVSRIQQD